MLTKMTDADWINLRASKLVVVSVKWRERLALGKSLATHSDERVATLEAATQPDLGVF